MNRKLATVAGAKGANPDPKKVPMVYRRGRGMEFLSNGRAGGRLRVPRGKS
jgi:hypothetical protein